jgi:hypothetical protein
MRAAPTAATHFVTRDTRRSPESRALGSFTKPEGTHPARGFVWRGCK